MNNKFYYFDQSNPGGGYDEFNGGKRHLLIEASDANEANTIAIGYGVYFDGVEIGEDCECCGDRWYPADEDDGGYNIKESVEAFGNRINDRVLVVYKK